MANVDWDLFSIVRSCNATSLTPPTIFEPSPNIYSIFETSPHSPTNTTLNKVISLQNYTPSYFDDFNLSHENNPIPFSPLKSNHFLPIEKFIPNFNPTLITPLGIPKPVTYIEITTEHFDLAYNHPSVLHELQRERNKLSISAPQTCFGVVPNTLSQHSKRKSWKKYNIYYLYTLIINQSFYV